MKIKQDFMHYRIKKDKEDVQAVLETIRSFINPFEYDGTNLVSLMSGVVATPKAQVDLLSVAQTGEDAAQVFIEKRVKSNSVDFYAPIKGNRPSTFVLSKKKKHQKKPRLRCRAATDHYLPDF